MKDFKRFKFIGIIAMLIITMSFVTVKAQQEYYYSTINEAGFIDEEKKAYDSEAATGTFMIKTDFTMFGFSFDSESYEVEAVAYMSRSTHLLEGGASTYIKGKAIDKEGYIYDWSVLKTKGTNKIKEFTISHEGETNNILFFQME